MNVLETKNTIKYLPWTHSIMLIGAHGLGKSDMWRQSAQELSVETGIPHELIDIRLAEREPGDVIGFPRRVEQSNPLKVTRRVYVKGELTNQEVTVWDVMTHDLPVWFPRDENWHGFILFDELDRSIREVQQSVMEMSLDHQLNMVPLPEHCRVGACCNGNPDVYTTLIPCPALLSRFVMIPFNPTTEEFFSYYEVIKGHAAIRKYLQKFPTDLEVPEGELKPYTVYPNRRAWVRLSQTLQQWPKGDLLKDDPDYMMKLSAGYVGDTVAVNFQTFVRSDYNIHSAEDILNGWNKKLAEEFAGAEPTDIAYYSKILVEFAGKNKLNKKQQANLKAWFFVISKESATGFYQLFLNTQRAICTDWYRSSDDIGEYVLNELLSEKK